MLFNRACLVTSPMLLHRVDRLIDCLLRGWLQEIKSPRAVCGYPPYIANGISEGRMSVPTTVGRLRNCAEKTVWLLIRLLFVYPRDLYNAATSRTLP